MKWPGAQGLQGLEGSERYFPGTQGLQKGLPSSSWNWPTVQSEHSDAFPSLNLPGGHGLNLRLLLLVGQKNPAAQKPEQALELRPGVSP